MFGTKLNYDSLLFLDGQEVSGINSVDISYSNSTNVINPLGYSEGLTTVAGNVSQNFSFTRDLISNSILGSGIGGRPAYTGDTNLSGSIHYDGNSYGFNSGYLNNWSVSCAVGAPVKETATFTVYDEMKTGVSASGSVAAPSIFVPSQGSITATCDNSSTNRVIGFDYNVSPKRKPYYSVAHKGPVEVKYLHPLQINATIQIEVDDAFMKSGRAFLETGKSNKSVSLNVGGREGTSTLFNTSIPNACLVGESLNASSDGSLRLTLNYMGHSS